GLWRQGSLSASAGRAWAALHRGGSAHVFWMDRASWGDLAALSAGLGPAASHSPAAFRKPSGPEGGSAAAPFPSSASPTLAGLAGQGGNQGSDGLGGQAGAALRER